MRIGIMCLASFGGSARIATQLAVQLAERGHRVHLFARTTPFDDKHYARGVTLHTVTPDREAGIHPAQLYTDWSAEGFQAYVSRVLDVIASEGLDILHFHYAMPFASVALEVKRSLEWMAPPVIGTLHGTDVSVHGRDPVIGPLLAQTLRHMDELTTVSNSHAFLAVDVLGLSPRPVVIPNFVDLSRFRPRDLLPISSHEVGAKLSVRPRPRIAHVSNFRPVKDAQSMARIFLGIREHMEAELWLIGDGPEMDSVRSILQQSGFEKDVRYWGLNRDVAPLLAQTDLLLMTSLSESFCLAALEAMACGVPVLATRVGGLPEVVVHGKTGFLYPAGDSQTAVRLAVELLSDQARHRAMREAAARHACRFGCEQIVPMYEDVYQRVLERVLARRSNRIPHFMAGVAQKAYV
jgi:N-acetyl-alpha-D-glucosaminyl L-malate synthase BshA